MTLIDDLDRALNAGPAVVLPAPGSPGLGHGLASEVEGFAEEDRPALIVHTSGSTGAPKGVALSAGALRSSAEATHAALGGPGTWYLPLPLTHIAGAQIVVRSLLAASRPLLADPGSFTATRFVRDTERLPGGNARRYTSLVPTQLERVLADDAATDAARAFHAILIGGSALREATREQAQEAGLHIVRTYGMSETAGGCVYDGAALPGTRVDVGTGPHDLGVLTLSGPMVASGYVSVDGSKISRLPSPAFGTGAVPSAHHLGAAALTDRSFRTSDLGRIIDGALSITGRADDVLISGGVNVHPHQVEAAALAALPELPGIIVTGVPDPEWGTRIVALVPGPALGEAALLATLRGSLRTRVEAAALPTRVVVVDQLPLKGIGKPDRAAAASLALRHQRSN